MPSEALTIYKSQGATYDKAVVHIAGKMSQSEMYVAFSRVTSLSGLFIDEKKSHQIEMYPDDWYEPIQVHELTTVP